jgi:transcriptional regulator with XRE-family HTH domain
MRNPYNRYMATKRDVALGALIKRYREDAGLKQAPVAEMLSRELGRTIRQTFLSELERGNRWSATEPDIYGAFSRVLNIPEDEMVEVAMHITQSNGPTRPQTWREIIEADPSLSDAAKAHLIAQYGLLQAASAHERSTKSSGSSSGGNVSQSG